VWGWMQVSTLVPLSAFYIGSSDSYKVLHTKARASKLLCGRTSQS
jgi:hypothetical protein